MRSIVLMRILLPAPNAVSFAVIFVRVTGVLNSVVALSSCATGGVGLLVGVLVGVFVGVVVGVSVGVLVGVFVGVSVDVLVAVGLGVSVEVLVAVLVGVFVGVSVGVFVGVFVGVSVAVPVVVSVGVVDGVLVAVWVAVCVGVGVAVGVCVGVPVAVFVGLLVGVAVFVGVGVGANTVTVPVFEVTPPTLAEALFVTEPAVISAAWTVYVAVHVTDSPGSRKSSRSPIVVSAGQVSSVALSSATVTGPSKGAEPLLVTIKL